MSRFTPGKVVLLVNTASFCGFTPQYEGLQKMQVDLCSARLHHRRRAVGRLPQDQEYAIEQGDRRFCKTKFGIKFPLAEKLDVVGPNAIPIYRWAAA